MKKITHEILAFALLTLGGCAAQVGSSVKQDSNQLEAINQGPTEVRLSDKDRGTLSSSGIGPGTWSRVMGDGVETQSVGVTPRRLFWKDGALTLDSGTDIAAKDVKIKASKDVTDIQIGSFSTLASTPIQALNEAYPSLVEYWKSRDEASRQVLIEQIKAAESISLEARNAIVALLTGIP